MFHIFFKIIFVNYLFDITCFSDWPTVKICIQNHPDFNHYFYKCPDDIPWTECELDMIKDFNNEKRIPCDILETGEAESAFRNHTNHLQLEKNRQGYVFHVLKYVIDIFIIGM